MSAIDQLLRVSSPSLIANALPDGIPVLEGFGQLGADLYDLLAQRNGFYAFESAFHAFPFGSTIGVLDLGTWNSPRVWRDAYGVPTDGAFFFAEDAFGFQFCLQKDAVCTFDAESGACAPMATSIEDWAGRLLGDSRMLLGAPLAHEWQVVNGPLLPGQRLAPKTPFVLGGRFEVGNLYAADSVELMRFRGQLATQIRGLADGATVTLKVTD